MTQDWGETFINNFVTTDNSFLIEDKKINSALNNINNYKNLLISLDIEFQTFINKEDNLLTDRETTITGESISSFPREFGMLIFQNNRGTWKYVGRCFINFDALYNYEKTQKDIMESKLLQSKYSTTTDEISKKLIENEEVFHLEKLLDGLEDMDQITAKDKINSILDNQLIQIFVNQQLQDKLIKLPESDNYDNDLKYLKRRFSKIIFEIYGKYLPLEYKDRFIQQAQLYWDDIHVKERMIKEREFWFLELFAKISHQTLFLIKGERDLIAIKNIYRLFLGSDKFININHKYDIEVFNGMSHTVFGSSQLEATYKGLSRLPQFMDNKTFFKKIEQETGVTAHNPLTDSYFTLTVAIIMNMIFTDCLNLS